MSRITTKFIANSAITNAKLANMADQTIKGNVSGSSAAPSDLTATQATAMLNNFVGDSGSGGTKGLVPAPASASTTDLEFLYANGTFSKVLLTNEEVSSTSNATTTSTTDVIMTGMTSTPVSGTYLVNFSTTLSSNTTSAIITVSIYVASTQQTHTIRTVTPQFTTGLLVSASINMPISLNAIVTVNGSQAISVQWHISSGTATANNRTMDIIRIGN